MSSKHIFCKICFSQLIVKNRCKYCDEPTRLFCQSCDIMAEKIMHRTCMILDVRKMLLEFNSK